MSSRDAAPSLELRGREFRWGSRTFIMGILNATPDSFSGDGLAGDLDAAVALARRMEADGADWLDIGGESSRPNAQELEPAEEARRVVPVIEAVRAATQLPISVDTCHAAVARAGIRAGADAINDIWGLRGDADMARAAREAGAVVIAMHNQRGRGFRDVVGDIRAGFLATLAICAREGIPRERIILDPGFGFGWTPGQNLEMLRRLAELRIPGLPLLVGTSRKSTIGHVLGGAPVDQRLEGTAATVALSIANGADIVRVHDVAEMVSVARMSDAIVGRGPMVPPAVSALVALGSNLGDRLGNLRAAVRMLAERGTEVTAKSSVWESSPVPEDQPSYLNAVIRVETRLGPAELLARLKEIERALGRRPGRRWGPRPADLDILFYGREAVNLPELQVPHPRILERGFILAPLAEVLTGELPLLGMTATEALAAVGVAGLSRYSNL